MDSKLLKIHMTSKDKRIIRDVLRENEHALSMEIVFKICEAIDNELDSVDIAEIITPVEIITIHSSGPNYLTTLETNLENLVKYEEYELCAVAKKHIDYLIDKQDLKFLEDIYDEN